MSTTTTVIPQQDEMSPQLATLEQIITQRRANTKDMERNSRHAAIGIGTYVVASILFPPAGIAGAVAMAGLFYGSWYGWDVVKNVGAERSLTAARQELAVDPTLEKTAARVATSKKRHNLFSNIMTGALVVAVAAIVATIAAPAALAAAAGTVLFGAFGVGLAAGIVETLAKGEYRAAETTVRFGQSEIKRAELSKQQANAPALAGPAVVATAPSPANDFDKAANSNTPPQPETPQASTTVLKQDAPKP